MKKLDLCEIQWVIKTGSEEDFFKRGRMLAKLADKHESLPNESVISFEDPSDMMKLLTEARLSVFRAAKENPGSITSIAAVLSRDRSSVKRDVDALASFGLLTVESKPLAGHGRMKEVRVAAKGIKLQAEL